MNDLLTLPELMPSIAASVAELISERTGDDLSVLIFAFPPQAFMLRSYVGQLCIASDQPVGDLAHLRAFLDAVFEAAVVRSVAAPGHA